MKTSLILGCAALVAALGMTLGIGCGDSSGDDDDNDGEGAGDSTGSSNNSEFSCCINGDGYDCPNKAAFDKCAGFDFAACDAACAPADGMCHADCADQASNATHDPSDCDPDANAPACNNNGTTGSGSCTPNAIGCDSSFECCEGLTCKTDPGSGTNGTFCLQ